MKSFRPSRPSNRRSAAYAIYDSTEKTVVIRRTEYDIRATQQKIRAVGLPEMLADRLSLGV